MTSAWATDPNPPSVEEHVARKIGDLTRARKRVVRLQPPRYSINNGQLETANCWVVEGDPKLSDTYVSYEVKLTGRRYHCACYQHVGGEYRQHRMCSHVKAVILYRAKQRKLDQARQRVRDRRGAEQSPVPDGVRPPVAEESPQNSDADVAPIPDPRDARFGQPPLPDWLQTFRTTQWDAVDQILKLYADGAGVVFVQAPTGSGKSVLGEIVRRELGGKTNYLCTTKHLQDQLAGAFPYAAVLKGRSNYPPYSAVDLWGQQDANADVTCADCTRTGPESSCRYCPNVDVCPYLVAKRAAIRNPLTVLNTAYWLTDCNKNINPAFAGRPFTIIDEADLAESELMRTVEVSIGPRRQKTLRLDPPARKTVEAAWVDWVSGEAIPKVEKRLAGMPPLKLCDTGQVRERKGLTSLLAGLEVLQVELPDGGWVYDGYQSGLITFKPIDVRRYGPQWIWQHSDRFLCMSATIISAQQMAEDLGLVDGWRVVDVPMTFPAANRPVHIAAIAEMNHKNKDESWPKMARACVGIVDRHPDERILIHTVSYKLAAYVSQALRAHHPRRPILNYTSSDTKNALLTQYLATPGAVLVAASMDRGVDLPNDACRVQVVCKLPYPNLGDKQVSARLHSTGGQGWYTVQTLRSLVQMTGRGVRHDTDRCTTYILDDAFTRSVWRKHKNLLPGWWVDSIDWRFDKRTLL